MKIPIKISLVIYRLIAVMIVSPFFDGHAQTSPTNFEDLRGIRHDYQIIDNDSLSSTKIVELRNEKGLPIWFSREIYKPVCLIGECKMVHLCLYWNGVSNYLGMQVLEPLTKTDHTEFTTADYKKLNRILSDSISVFKKLHIEDLTVAPENKDNKVDAKSGATEPSIIEYVVKDAVYTCYTLWFTVYGPTQEKIRSILTSRANNDYFRLIFDQNDPQYISWAIDYINHHNEFHHAFYHDIMNQIKNEDPNLSHKAAMYFTPFRLQDSKIQKELAAMLSEVSSNGKYEIISIFSELQQINNDAILVLLKQYEDKKINGGMLGYVCKMVRPVNLEDDTIKEELNNLSKDSNPYVVNMIQNILSNE